ncbi:hypothetical protein [Spirosoma taeanense]|nr:hypothetical protein [Spirosoma taeanense]
MIWLTVRSAVDKRVFLASAFLLLFLLRLPSIVFDSEINPDESQMITQALTLRSDPVYFRSVDGTTGGPLDSYFLIVPSLFGLPFDYITAHLTAFGLVALCLWFLFRTASLWFGEGAARLALTPMVFMLGLTQNGDFLHYNSELIALLLLSGSYYLYALVIRQPSPSLGRVALIGLLLGMVPFGKLQAVPLAAVVGLFVGLDLLTRPNLNVSAKAARIGVLVLGGITFPLVFVLLTWINSVYNDFVTFYIIGNFRYANDSNQLVSLLRLPIFFEKGSEFDWLVKLTGLIWLVGVVVALRRRIQANRSLWQVGGFVGVLLVATLIAITRTGSEYVHYLYFLTGPLFFLLAYGWQQLRLSNQMAQWFPIGVLSIYLLLFGIQAVQRYRQGIALNPYSSEGQGGWAVQQSPVSKEIRKYGRPGEKLAVWGWRCDYYVQTQMPQGVAENHTIRSTFAHPMRDDYQRRYVKDFKRSKPAVFVDAVGSQNLWMTDRNSQGHEIIGPLRQFVATNYHYAGLVNDTRIYVRNDRVAALK